LGCPLPKGLLEKQTLQKMYTSGNYITPAGDIYVLCWWKDKSGYIV